MLDNRIKKTQIPNTIVIVDNNANVTGGTAQVAINSAVALSKIGKRIIYVSADKESCDELKNANIEIHNMDEYGINTDPNKIRAALNGIWNRKVATKFKELLRHLDPETTIVHIHGYLHFLSPSVFKVCSDMRFHTVLTLHDYFIVCPNGGFYDQNEKKICDRSPMSLKCIACNCDKRSYVQKIWRILRQNKINRYVKNNRSLNLIYISKFSFSKIEPWIRNIHKAYYVKNPYDFGSSGMVVAEDNSDYLYVGTISFGKGVDLFCEVLSKLKREKKIKGQIIVIGDGELRNALESKYTNIEFVGWKQRSEIEDYMKNARALVFPSRWYEGAPLTPIEFMSHGIPCIVSDCCAATDYIHDKNGIVFKGEDIEDLEKKVLCAEDGQQWYTIARKLRRSFSREDYSTESHVEHLIEVYENVYGGKKNLL